MCTVSLSWTCARDALKKKSLPLCRRVAKWVELPLQRVADLSVATGHAPSGSAPSAALMQLSDFAAVSAGAAAAVFGDYLWNTTWVL